jgi:drug/metabolite transporter (DMT)-like permease
VSVVPALLSSLLWGVSDFLGGTATKRLRAVAVVGGSQGIALLGLLAYAVAAGELTPLLHEPSKLLPGVAAGLIGATALAAFYAALAEGTMGVIAPVAALGVLLPVIVGLARGEAPSPVQVVGIALAIGGVVLASGPELSGGASPRPLLLAFGAAIGFGSVAILLAKGASEHGVGVLGTVLSMRATSTALMLLVGAALLVRGQVVTGLPGRQDLLLLAAIGVGDVGANASFATAAHDGLLSVVAVLGSLYPVVTVLLARRVHQETLTRIQVIGVAGALGGVALLAAG